LQFGAEYQLSIKCYHHALVAPPSDATEIIDPSIMIDHIVAFVHEEFAGARVFEKFSDSLSFMLPSSSIVGADAGELGLAFEALETRGRHLGIVEFSLSQATLEQIFLRFAKGDQ